MITDSTGLVFVLSLLVAMPNCNDDYYFDYIAITMF